MPISDCEVRDPRIRKTRQLFHDALLQLLGSKPFDDISVQDIADVATLNRATFYDHYTDKFSLLEAMIAGGFHKMLRSAPSASMAHAPRLPAPSFWLLATTWRPCVTLKAGASAAAMSRRWKMPR